MVVDACLKGTQNLTQENWSASGNLCLFLYESNEEINIRLHRAENSEPCEEVIKLKEMSMKPLNGNNKGRLNTKKSQGTMNWKK